MSNTHPIGKSAETVSRSAAPLHPLTQAVELDSCSCRDALSNCAATLYMLADLFGDADMERYPTMDSSAARRGMFLQLFGVAGTLEAINAFLEREAEEASDAREAERQARKEARRAEEDRIAEDPAVIEKRVILAGAFADIFSKVVSDAKPATAE